jgi:hypothetical protein
MPTKKTTKKPAKRLFPKTVDWRSLMINAELNTKIADTMATLRGDALVASIKKEWRGYMDAVKEEARKAKKKGETLSQATTRLTEDSPCELYCYIMFDDSGDLRGWTIDHAQYWQGNSGPTSAISLSPDVTYEEIEREIGNDLAEALEIED